MGFTQVFALVNPRGYFLSLAVAVDRCGFLNKWILFRVPSQLRHLLVAVREIAPFVRAASEWKRLKSGIYPVLALYSFLQKENKFYKDAIPAFRGEYGRLVDINSVKREWTS